MKTLSTNQVRQAFIDFFVSKQHTHVASSSLIPFDDPTLLFTNAGMNQFKDTFLGIEHRPYVRAVTAQKCVRAGGKHNDLDNVGYTARHHTFFEMMGNFSFGDYFKKEAIAYAWEFLTSEAWLGLPKDRLYATVYHNDDEAYNIWRHDIGLPSERVIRIGDKGEQYQSYNFWMMGDTGPCGPCSEIFYDHGEHIWGGLPGTPEEDGDRYVEIWNNVFMQFNRQKDGTLQTLPAPSVDTGMGLERISAVMQGVHGNYETDTFVTLMDAAAGILGIPNDHSPSLKVLADHIRAVTFLIADGVRPSNEGRGYVLRRILRRAIRHGNKLGAEGSFFYRLVSPLVSLMGEAYPAIQEYQNDIEALIQKEEEQFAKTLAQGLRLLSSELDKLSDNATLEGETVFRLYDTYGFPVDLTADISRERGIGIDVAGFERHMDEQRQRARESGKFDMDYTTVISSDQPSEFLGYETLSADSQIVGVYREGKAASLLQEGDQGVVVLDATPFYAESGGQVGELGEIVTTSGVFVVENTVKSGITIVHHGVVKMGEIRPNQDANAQVASDIRSASAKNHSATHLLHAALRQVLGAGVAQKGSLVSSSVLRFDFSHDAAISPTQLDEIERIVNAQIQANTPVSSQYRAIDDAIAQGAMALFGEKYGDTVRVLTMGQKTDQTPFSIELCGGLHVERTGDIGVFKIVSEGSIASGIRRIEALTGMGALAYIQSGEQILSNLASTFKAKRPEIAARITTLSQKQRELDKHIERLEQKLASFQAMDVINNAIKLEVNGANLIVAVADGVDAKAIRGLIDTVKSRLQNAVVVIVGQSDDLVLAASVAKGLTDKVKAGDIVRHLANELGGKGGGKADYAQGGAPKSTSLNTILEALVAKLQADLT